MMNETSYSQLSWAMIRTGVLGFGGGPSVIPLIKYEAVTRYKWMENEEFAEIVGLANALPGPIATKLAAYLGYSRKGVLGAIIAVLAHILPSSLAMIALMSVVSYLSSSTMVQGMISAVIPVIAVMLGVMAYEFAERAVKGLGKPLGFTFFIIAFLLLQVVQIHEALVIIIFLIYGTLHFKLLDKYKKRKEHGGST